MQFERIESKARNLILLTCIGVAIVTAPLSFWALVSEVADSVIFLTRSEVKRVHTSLVKSSLSISEDGRVAFAQEATNALIGGMFDYADYYSVDGVELAESKTPFGALRYGNDESHDFKKINKPDYSIQDAFSEHVFFNIVLPIYAEHDNPRSELIGYMQLGRAVPDWRRGQIIAFALLISGLAAGSALMCGLIIYPIFRKLIRLTRTKHDQVTESHINLVEALGRAVAKKEANTGTHNYRVTWIAVKLAEAMKLGVADIQNLISGAFLHDVGKIAIPDAILLKPGKLTDEEWKVMRDHVLHGEEIVKGIGWLETGSLSVVSGHHERWDGTGYPRQLSGEGIPLLARIFAVADVFDALASQRPYKEKYAYEAVMAYINEQSGKHFDPSVVSALGEISYEIFQTTSALSENESIELLNPLLNKYLRVEVSLLPV